MDIIASEFIIFYEALWKSIVDQEWKGERPKNLQSDFGPYVFSADKNESTLEDYLFTNPAYSNVVGERYIYKKYLDAKRGATVEFKDILLFNCLSYMKLALNDPIDRQKPLPEQADLLWDLFKHRNYSLFQKSISNKKDSESVDTKAEMQTHNLSTNLKEVLYLLRTEIKINLGIFNGDQRLGCGSLYLFKNSTASFAYIPEERLKLPPEKLYTDVYRGSFRVAGKGHDQVAVTLLHTKDTQRTAEIILFLKWWIWQPMRGTFNNSEGVSGRISAQAMMDWRSVLFRRPK